MHLTKALALSCCYFFITGFSVDNPLHVLPDFSMKIIESGQYNDVGDRIDDSAIIKAKIGARFGFYYQTTPLPEGEIRFLEYVTIHPPIFSDDGKSIKTTIMPIAKPSINGMIFSGASFSFQSPSDLMPGAWRIEVRCG